MMGSQAPPHPGSFWQECQDVNTGYAYYWNTINNQVVWECPLELIQYRQSLLAVPPPLPPPPTTLTAASSGAGTGKGLVGLVGGYGSDTDDDNEEKAEKENGEAKEKKSGDDDVEKDPEFIGPKIPKLPQEETNDVEMVENGKNVEVDPSILNLNPPDIQDENSEPPIPGMEDSSMPEEPVMSITEQILSSLPPPPPPLVPAGLASLVSAYSDSDNSEDEDEKPKPVKSHFKEVKGQMDSSGRLRFGAHTSWQTEEQKAALASYMVEEKASVLKAEVKKSAKTSAKETVVAHGRKQRLALPGGKFNKSDSSDKKPSVEPKSDYALKFVKSDSVLPGSEPPKQDEVGSETQEDLDARVQRLMAAQASLKAPTPEPQGEGEERPSPPPTPPAQEKLREKEPSRERSKSVEEKEEIARSDLSEDELAEELVEKLQHFKVNTEKISALKLLAVKIETLYSAWCAGALNRKYLKIFLENAHRKMILVEKFDLSTGPWTARWDRNEKRYEFTNSETGVTTHINPNSGGLVVGFDEPESPQPPSSPQAAPPPPPPPSDSPPAPPPADSPPPPAAPASPAPPPPPPEDELEDGEVDEELDELINPTQTLVGTSARSSVSPSATVNNEPEDMDMSEDELNENDDDGVPLTPPTPGGLSSDHESDDDREGLSATTPPPGMESTPKPRSNRATASEDMMHAVQRGDLPPPPPGVVTTAAPGLTVSAKPQVKVPAPAEKRSLNLTDELSSFYSEIGFSDPVDEPVAGGQEDSLPEAATSHPVSSAEPTPPREIGSGGDSGPPSPTGSPVPKKRKKKDKNVKVSSSLSMKKKGLNSMLIKWQNIK